MSLVDAIEETKAKAGAQSAPAELNAPVSGELPQSLVDAIEVFKTGQDIPGYPSRSQWGWEYLLEPDTVTGRSIRAAGKGLGFIFDILSRGEYASAGAASALLQGKPLSVPGRILQGALGRDKTTYRDVMYRDLPAYQERAGVGDLPISVKNWPNWLKSAVGFVLGVGLDPLNYLTFGAPAATKAGRSLVKIAGTPVETLPVVGKYAEEVGERVFSSLDDVSRFVRGTATGQYIAKQFSTKAELPEGMWEMYQKARNEMAYLADQAVKANVPIEEAVKDLEKATGIPRNVLSELIEKPVFLKTEEMVQKALPLTAEVPVEAGRLTRKYLVESGDTLSAIAKQYDVTVNELMDLNSIKDPRKLAVGQELKIPVKTKITVDVPVPAQAAKAVADPVEQAFEESIRDLQSELRALRAEGEAVAREGRSGLIDAIKELGGIQGKSVSSAARDYEDLASLNRRFPGILRNNGAAIDEMVGELGEYGFHFEDANALYEALRNEAAAGKLVDPEVAGRMSSVEDALEEAKGLLEQYRKDKAALPVPEATRKVQKLVKDLGLPLTREVPVGKDEVIGSVTKAVSNLDKFPAEVRAKLEPIQKLFKEWADDLVKTEQAAGIAIKPLESDTLEYLSHYMTPEAKEALAKEGSNWRRLLEVKVQHGSTLPRRIKDLSIQEVNELGMVGKIIPGYAGKVFMDDPVVLKTVRDVMSARAVASARFLDQVLTKPEWALKEGAPEGWKELGEAAVSRFGPKVEGYRFAPEVADALNKVIRKTFEPEETGLFLRGYDKFLSFWRRITLGTSPRWMVNNAVGNLWNCFLADIDPKAYATAGEVMLKKAGKVGTRTFAEVMDLAKREGVWNAALYGSELEKSLADAVSGKGLRSLTELVTSPIFKGNTLIENHARLSLFVDGLQKGLSPDAAASRVRKYLFDYTDLTDFEKNVMRRIVPFYTWYRKNLPLQLEALAQSPGKFAAIPKAVTAVEATQPALQDKESLPDWMKRELPVQVAANPEGYTKFLTLGNLPALDPFQTTRLQDVLSMNPLANVLGSLMGLDIGQGRFIEPSAMENVLGAVPMGERWSRALEGAVPPLQTLQGIVHPYQSKYGTTPSLPERLLGVTGLKLYERFQPADWAAYINGIKSNIDDLERQYRDAMRQGDQKLAEALLKRIVVLQDLVRQETGE